MITIFYLPIINYNVPKATILVQNLKEVKSNIKG